jgi:Family of unknown function (DUF5990)
VLIRIEGTDLPGRAWCAQPGVSPNLDNVHVAVQGRNGPQDLVGLVAADASAAAWEIPVQVVSRSPVDLRGPQIQGNPERRFVYLSWCSVGRDGSLTMFRRAKLWLDAVPEDVLAHAVERGLLVGRLGLTDAKGGPVCASVRPPLIDWSA